MFGVAYSRAAEARQNAREGIAFFHAYRAARDPQLRKIYRALARSSLALARALQSR